MFYKRLKQECQNKGTSITAMLKELNISSSSGTAWRNGALPTGETMLKIKVFLNTSIDYLLTGEKTNNNINTEEQELIKNYNILTEKNKGKVELLMEQLYNKQEEERADAIAESKERKLG